MSRQNASIDRHALVEDLQDAHDSFLGVITHTAQGDDQRALDHLADVRETLDDLDDALDGGDADADL